MSGMTCGCAWVWHTRRMKLRYLVAAATLLSAGGCRHNSHTIPVDTLPPQTPLPGELTLGPGDIFDVRVFGEADLSSTYRVGDNGTIDYPLIGQIRVEGLEPHQAAQYIASQLAAKYLKHPQVSILVKEQSSKKIIVIGQVAKPGTYPFTVSMSVIEAITVAGGFTPMAAKNNATVTRMEGGKKVALEVRVADIGEGKAKNISLRPGDIISVPERLF